MLYTFSVTEVLEALKKQETGRSYWAKGVKETACQLLEKFRENRWGKDIVEIRVNAPAGLYDALLIFDEMLRNGAESWEQYAYGGCGLIYDGDICQTFCSPSRIKRKKGGVLPPNSRESWMDVYTRALRQAGSMITYIVMIAVMY